MSTTERATTARMRNDITDEEWDLIVDTDILVCRQITCPVTGQVLDTRTAVLVTAGNVTSAVVPDASDEAVHRLADAGFDPVLTRGPISPDTWSKL